MKYKLKVEDRNYETWTTHDPHSLESTQISLDPVREKLFDQDIFEYDLFHRSLGTIQMMIMTRTTLIDFTVCAMNERTSATIPKFESIC